MASVSASPAGPSSSASFSSLPSRLAAASRTGADVVDCGAAAGTGTRDFSFSASPAAGAATLPKSGSGAASSTKKRRTVCMWLRCTRPYAAAYSRLRRSSKSLSRSSNALRASRCTSVACATRRAWSRSAFTASRRDRARRRAAVIDVAGAILPADFSSSASVSTHAVSSPSATGPATAEAVASQSEARRAAFVGWAAAAPGVLS
mmetsp:Transcript_34600/g.106884  ORF Transcript_34600/g.106884 Transcript_34600/m.106884 type:complete len:205 (+) Transcript_34600:795-1409(+)